MSPKGQRVLVTGGAGYIGSHTLPELMLAGHEVHVIDDLSNGHGVALKRCRQIVGRDFGFSEADIRDAPRVAEVVRAFAPDVVIHFAGLKSPSESIEKPDLYREVNVIGSLRLLDAMRAGGCQRLVFSSSAAVYGPPDFLPISEDHPRRPTTPYGASKAEVEDILVEEAAKDTTLTCAILRYFNPVGAHASGLIGEHPQDIPTNLVPYIVDVARGRLPRLNLFGDDYGTPDGTGVRDYIHVTDLARAHVAALDWTAGATGAREFNLGTGEGTSVRDLIRTFENATGRDIPFVVAPRRPGDVASSYADPGRAERELKWKAELTLTDMCRSAWAWGAGNPEGYA